MKIIGVVQNVSHSSHCPTLFIKPDTAIHHSELPFYLPDFSKDIRGKLGIVIKISKQGKCISEKFAHKYYEEMTFGIDFTAYDILQELQQRQQPWELAKSFDNSIIMGAFFPKDIFSDTHCFWLKNSQKIQQESLQNIANVVQKHIAYSSQFVTLRKGDCIFLEMTQNAEKISINDTLQILWGDNKILEVTVL